MSLLYKRDARRGTKIAGIARFALILSLSLCCFHAMGQQTREVSGTVTDQTGAPVVGAAVVVRGSATGAITDAAGSYTLGVPPNATLQISCVGFSDAEVAVGSQRVVNVVLTEDVTQLEAVVAVGYGTQRKGDISSAISTIRAEDLVKTPAPDVAQMLRGQIAGLAISTPDGNPVGSSQMILRGTNTMKQSAAPLVLIDGFPGALNDVSPEDIEQIDVLKDGSAAAIYGTRGTNGVILITTKNVNGEMPTRVEVNSYLSTQTISRKLDIMTADEYRQIVKQGKTGAKDDGATTDWLDEVTQTPITQIYNISLRGGSKQTNYSASFEYRDMQGLMKRTQNTVIYPRIEITHRMFDNKLRLNGSVRGGRMTYWAGGDNDRGYNTGVYRNAITYNPTTPLRDKETGGWHEKTGITDYLNPVGLYSETHGQNQGTFLRMMGSAIFTPIEGLEIKYSAGSNVYNQARGYFETSRHVMSRKNSRVGFASRGTNRTQNDLSELTVTWRKSIDDHSFTLLGGYSWMRTNYQFYWMQNWTFPSDEYTYNAMQLGDALREGKANMNSYQSESKLIGYFGRFNYSYKGRYMLSGSIRHEGSSKFGANHKWGTFPSISGAWSIKDEPFMQNLKPISALKLRVGYGVTGTEPGDPYLSLTTISFGTFVNYDGAFVRSMRPATNANPDLRWEQKREANFGLDAAFLDDRLSLTVDYYRRTTVDMIWDYSVPVPPYLYPTMTANGGSIRNAGIEVTVSGFPVRTKELEWRSSVNFSHNKSELLRLSSDKYPSSGYTDQGWIAEPMQTNTHRVQEGQPIGNFYGFKSVDIDDDGFWIIEGADGKPKPISEQQPDDKKVIGNALPKYYLNWNNTVTYKNFDLNVTMRGAFDFDILNYTALQFGNPTMLTRGNLLNSTWDNVYGKRPLNDTQGPQYVSYYVEKGDYWKIDNVTLGYTFDLNSKWLSSLRVFGTVTNLATITGYSGIDPELGIAGLSPGVDDKDRYPAVRMFTFGASLKF